MYSSVKSKKIKVKCKKWSVLNKILFIFAFLFLPFFVEAQCAMCRAALESEESGVQAEAINDGIVFLMVIPYILVAAAGYAIYRLKFAKKKNNELEVK
ncbi:conserved hypothetical protein [Flavobacterium sp. 9AF]|uniref:hypothetical protein n=1 Tax=Flavobacterium sp. 9AF TaxID=2653142 RepID=UPI0012F1F378|nr:hypothetical protein [Flavobacterium sp. 9AF]VXB15894.1 conserved hypothetical protein [Flavobacterium sp. 9AF]